MIGMHSRAVVCQIACLFVFVNCGIFGHVYSSALSLILEVPFQKEQKLWNYLWILWISNANLFSTDMID